MESNIEDDFDNKATYTFGGNDNRETIEVKNTYQLQLTSLLIFAAAIDYEYDPTAQTDGSVFVYVGEGKTGYSIVKFNTMRDWYNFNFAGVGPRGWRGYEEKLPNVSKELRLDMDKMKVAIDNKLIRQVFLQSGKDKILKVQKHIITEGINIENILAEGTGEEVLQLEEACGWVFEKDGVKEEK